MSSKLSSLADNLSEGHHSYKCTNCESYLDYMIIEDDHLIFRCFKRKKKLGDYQDLYVQSDTLILADVFENFRNKCIEICEFNPAHFLSAHGLAWQACLKRSGVKLELLIIICC